MIQTTPDPEKDPLPPDEFDRLEEMHQRVKEKQEAWRKLLESLSKLKKGNTHKTEDTEPQQPFK